MFGKLIMKTNEAAEIIDAYKINMKIVAIHNYSRSYTLEQFLDNLPSK